MNTDDAARDDSIRFLSSLDELIRERMLGKPANSYVASLIGAGDKRLAQKLGEEAVELAIAATAGDRDEQLEEAADLLFHLLVLLNAKGIRLEHVTALLQQRHQSRGDG
jgi:phosphoribosyl-ATP pyrophosphohydrolase/phosphoribosyl-AMP cyclohydrolase